MSEALATQLQNLAGRYKADPESVYHTWFVHSPERLKAFRAIRRGVIQVVDSIRGGTFGNTFKESELEVVLESITEQKQVFEGAAHAFYWKPKLRIPDIYESLDNQRAFGEFLAVFLGSAKEDRLVEAIRELDRKEIKGVGPAVSNIIYFLHPTLFPPSNTAILRGFNSVFSDSKKLGSWSAYLEMRETISQSNSSLGNVLSTDLGAFAGLLYEVGVGRLVADSSSAEVLGIERQKIDREVRRRHEQADSELREENEHLKMQALLTQIGRALGYQVHVAVNDRNRVWEGRSLAESTIDRLPHLELSSELQQTISLIDVIWLSSDQSQIVCAFEVEKSTSIYSGILRLLDLSESLSSLSISSYLVAPDSREKEIQAQLRRPSFANLGKLDLRYLLFSDLRVHCDGLCTFGKDYTALLKIARCRG